MNSGLKLCLCLVCTLFFAVPYVHADSYTPTFDCSRGCNAAPPTAPDVTFPSPTLMVLFGGVTWDFTLPAVDLPGDTYLWGMFDSCIGDSFVDTFVIVDVTTNETEQSAVDTTTAPFGAGNLTFNLVTATPEPSSVALTLLGIVVVPLVRKRTRQSVQQAS